MQNFNFKKFFSISILVHILIFLFLGLTLFHVYETRKDEQYSLPTYVYDTSRSFNYKETKGNPNPSFKNIKTIARITSPKPVVTHHHLKSFHDSAQSASNSKKDVKLDQKIVKILHELIAQKQYYPENVQGQAQRNIVKIGFSLNPNGYLENISILQSSGIAPIDAAALAAVKNISPAKEAGVYLKTTEFFSVDIVFEQE